MGLEILAGRLRLLTLEGVPALRLHRSRRDGGDEDIGARPEIGEGLGEIDEGGIRGAAHHVGRGGITRRRPHHVDDASPALLLHHRKDRPRHADVPQELEAPAAHPLVVRSRQEVASLDRPGIVDEDIEPPETREGLGGRALHAGQLGEIDGQRLHRLSGLALDGARRIAEGIRAPRADHDARAFRGHGPRRRQPYALAAARDERRLALELEIHGSCTSFW